MKKRIMCALLTLIMLVGMVPMGASAAGLNISESAITVLKNLEVYESTCTQHGTEYRNGYGTICTLSGNHSNHKINEKTADKALRAKLVELDAAVNAFSSKTGKNLTQGQHDALVVFSYDVGTSWMNGTGVMRSAVVNGLTGNDFINTICGFKSDDDDARRRVEANMYLEGKYSATRPYNYAWVKFDPNGGKMAENEIFYYDYNEPVTITRIASREANIFMGWYTPAGAWITTLNDDTDRVTLEARWQSVAATSYNQVNYKMSIGAFTSRQPLAKPDEDADDYGDKIESGKTVTIVEDYIDKNGARWCRISGSGWVKMGAYSGDANGVEIDVIVTVTNDYVRSRKNATIHSTQNGTYYKGDKLRIINTASADGFLWGQVANDDYEAIGWVALMYTDWNSVKDNNTSNGAVLGTAVINCEGYLNVRKNADADSTIVGALADGDTVDIYEVKVVNGHQWGRTTGGWILLTYAKVTYTSSLPTTLMGDVLSYTFTGTMNKDGKANVEPSYDCDRVGSLLKKGTRVAFSLLKMNGTELWGYNGTGWLSINEVDLDPATFIVVADAVTVRANPGSSANSVEKVVKGVELTIKEFTVRDATIWGKTEKYGGWVNLASKYVQRTNAPIIEQEDNNNVTGLIATVVNTDSVRVRQSDSTSSAQIGSLTGGTIVAVWEINEDEDWYKVDSNGNGVYDYDGDGWVYSQYLDIQKGSIGGSDSTGSTGTGSVETGLGIIANTYSGVNVRTGAGTGNAQVGKILTGTTVEILEVKQAGAAKWGRVTQGWICMDYVTMIKNYPIAGATPDTNTESNAGVNAGGSTTTTEGSTTVSSTPAVYEGVTTMEIEVLKTADTDAEAVRTLSSGSRITIQELRKVTTKITASVGTVVDGNTVTETESITYETTYWARVNDGWIVDPENNLQLNSLDEIIYTATSDSVGVYYTPNGSKHETLDKGAQFAVTKLEVHDDKVWGYVEDLGGGTWVRLDQVAEGAIDTTPAPTQPEAPSDQLILGSTGNTANNGTNGFVNNAGGYRYTGTVIRTNSVNVRATASQTAALTTTLSAGSAMVIYETTINEGMAWGRCDAGWVYLYYVDLQPCNNAVDAKVVYNENTIAYTDANCTSVAGTYSRMSVVDIYEVVGNMAKTDLGWVHTDNLG